MKLANREGEVLKLPSAFTQELNRFALTAGNSLV